MAQEVHLSLWLGKTRCLTPYLPILVESLDKRPISKLLPSGIVSVAQTQTEFSKVLELVDPYSTPVYYMGPALPAPDVTGDIPIPPSRTVESVASPSGVIYLQAAIPSAPTPGPAGMATGGASASSGGGAGGASAGMATGGAGGTAFRLPLASVPPPSAVVPRRQVQMGVEFTSVWHQELYIRNTPYVRTAIKNSALLVKHIHGSVMRISKDVVRLVIVALDEASLASFQELVNSEFGEHISGAPDEDDVPVPAAKLVTADTHPAALKDARKAFQVVGTRPEIILGKPSVSPNEGDGDGGRSEGTSSARSPLMGMGASARSFGSH